MAIDPRISLGVQGPQLNDPLETVGKAIGLQNALARGREDAQRQQIGAEELKQIQLKNQAAQKAQATEDEFQGVRREVGGNIDTALNEYEKRGGNPVYIAKLREDQAKAVKALSEAKESQWKEHTTQTDAMANDVGALAQEQDPAALGQRLGQKLLEYKKRGWLTPDQVQEHVAEFQAKGPAAIQGWYTDLAGLKGLNAAAAQKRLADEESRKVETHNLDVANKTADLSKKYMEEAGVLPESDAQSKTSDIKNYEYARDKQGFKGSFQDYQKADANLRTPKPDNGVALQNQLDREANTFRTPHQKALTDADSKLQTVADAKAMINSGAMGQALGLPKVLSALVGGTGSGLRMTEAELSRIGKARGIKGDIEGFFNQITGQGNLTAEQKKQATQILDDVGERLKAKREIANDALDRINSAKSRDEITKVDSETRNKLHALESGTPAQSRIKILKVE